MLHFSRDLKVPFAVCTTSSLVMFVQNVVSAVEPFFVRVNVFPSHSFAGTRAEVQTKSAFLNKESVKREVQATVSQKATLSCEVVDNKTEVKWYKDGKQLTPSRAVHVDSKGKIRQLVIDSVEKKDAGEYICEAGADKLAFRVQVTGMVCFKVSLIVFLYFLKPVWLNCKCCSMFLSHNFI